MWLATLAVLAVSLVHTPAAAQQADGQAVFRQRSAACHSIDPGQRKSGPHLAAIIGRPAGSIDGARYSDAMRGSGLVWDGQTLDAFLAAPRRLVPGTTMTVSIPDAAQRAAIITYLQSQTPTANN